MGVSQAKRGAGKGLMAAAGGQSDSAGAGHGQGGEVRRGWPWAGWTRSWGDDGKGLKAGG